MEKFTAIKRERRHRTAAHAPGRIASAPALPGWLRRDWFWGLLLVAAIVATYQPVWSAAFIWDDDIQLTANPCIAGPLGLEGIWTTSTSGYYPLVMTTFWVEHALWGFQPLPYHLVNVLMHCTCALLFWRVLKKLRVPGAWFGAALWALHPVQVETAAWVTELKNTQSGVFYLLAILFYLEGLQLESTVVTASRARWNYLFTLLFAAMAMASKPSTVVLPLVLALLAWWVKGEWSWSRVARLWPFALMTIFSCVLTLWTQKIQGAGDPHWARSFPQRIATAGDAIWFYLGKLAWPHPLIFIYPRWDIDAGAWYAWLPLLAVIGLLVLLWRARGAWARPCFFTFAYFIIALLPVLGFIDGFFWRFSLVGDHFQYLASMGPLALAGAGLSLLANRTLPTQAAALRPLGGAVLLAILGIMSWQQAWVYQDVATLWSNTEIQNPQCWLAFNNLGNAYIDLGQIEPAKIQFQRAVEIYPGYAEAHNNLGNVETQTGHIDAAIPEYKEALKDNPDYPEADNGLGNALMQKGRLNEAIALFQKSITLSPYYVAAYSNLGNALVASGRLDEGITAYVKALDCDPSQVQIRYNLGWALQQKGQFAAAVAQYQTALQMTPNSAILHYSLGNALLGEKQYADAIAQYEAALNLTPNDNSIRNNLAAALMENGQTADAIVQFEEILKATPNNFQVRNNLGSVFLRNGQIDDAIAQYAAVLKAQPNYASAHLNLGLALLKKGQDDAALAQFQEAVRLKPGDPVFQDRLAKAKASIAQQKKTGKK